MNDNDGELWSGPGTDAMGVHRGNVVLTNVHTPDRCAGRACVLHNPSAHHMRDWPTCWRDDRRIMERTCPHGVGHPDPDDARYRATVGDVDTAHGCDGCCRPPGDPPPERGRGRRRDRRRMDPGVGVAVVLPDLDAVLAMFTAAAPAFLLQRPPCPCPELPCGYWRRNGEWTRTVAITEASDPDADHAAFMAGGYDAWVIACPTCARVYGGGVPPDEG